MKKTLYGMMTMAFALSLAIPATAADDQNDRCSDPTYRNTHTTECADYTGNTGTQGSTGTTTGSGASGGSA